MTLYRKTKRLEFDDGTVDVKELSAGDLLDAETNGIPMDMAFFFDRCAGLDLSVLSPEAYKAIAEAIIELHPSMFGDEAPQGGVKKK